MVTLFLIFLLSGAALEQSKGVSVLPSHHTPKGFQSPYRPSERGLGDFLRWQSRISVDKQSWHVYSEGNSAELLKVFEP